MLAQLIKMRLKPEKDRELAGVLEQLRALRSSRTPGFCDLPRCETRATRARFTRSSSSRARRRLREGAGSATPGRTQSVQPAMGEVFDGPPEFVNLTVAMDD